jgi:phospholipase/carboxylesterase
LKTLLDICTVGSPPALNENEIVPAAASREAESALTAAGVTVEAVFRPGLGHGLDEAGMALGALALQRYLGTPA